MGEQPMLRLTKKADYGMMAMRYLAERADEGAHSARDIAEAYRIPPQALAKVLQALARADLTVSHAGPTGGYTLARPAKNINAFDVISALDGPLIITSCTTVHGSCELASHCTVQEPLRRVNDSIKALLSNISVADLSETANNAQSPNLGGLVNILR